MLSTKLPVRSALSATRIMARPRIGLCTGLGRGVTLQVAARAYATPAKPKKGSIGAEKRGRAPKKATTKPATTTRKVAAKAPAKKATKEQPTAAAVARKAAAAARKAAAAAKAKEVKAKQTQKAKDKRAADAAKKKARADKVKATAAAKKKAAAAKKTAAIKVKANSKPTKVKVLKVRALSPPSAGVRSGFVIFHAAKSRNAPHDSTGVAASAKTSGSEWKALSPSEKESYVRRAVEDRAKGEQELKAWVASKSPEEIRQANKARKSLRRLEGRPRAYPEIKDPRQLSLPINSYLRFRADYKVDPSLPITERAKQLAGAWKSLSDAEKKPYNDAYAEGLKLYEQQFLKLYGVPIKTKKAKEAPGA